MKAIDRLYQYIEYKDYKPTVFEREIGLSSGYLSVQRKRNADIGETVINKINDNCHDINIEWLLTGKGEMLKKELNIDKKQGAEPLNSETIDKMIDLATQLGMQIKENEQLHRKNMELTAELENLKNKKETEVQKMPVQRLKDRTERLPDIAAEP